MRQKLILLGAHQSGKTSLLRTMTSGQSKVTSGASESTALIDFRAWTTENKVDFLICDTSGEDVYAHTLHLFLDPNALYVIVYDHRSYQLCKSARNGFENAVVCEKTTSFSSLTRSSSAVNGR